jgi:predicted O-methyltransferase YrrM
MTSDYEAWIIASLSKISKNIFEFGTCSGKTTYLMALNSHENSAITSITLDPDEITTFIKKNKDNEVSFRNIKNESIYNHFLFSNTEVEKKINIIFQNSLEFDEQKFEKKIDLILLMGDTRTLLLKTILKKALKMLNTEGIILWHDYVPGKRSSKDVVKYINEISKNLTIKHIKNTSICFYKNSN